MSENEIQGLKELLNEVIVRITRLEEKLSNIPLCGANCAKTKTEDMERRITKLEKNQSWVVMAVVIAVITALLKLILK